MLTLQENKVQLVLAAYLKDQIPALIEWFEARQLDDRLQMACLSYLTAQETIGHVQTLRELMDTLDIDAPALEPAQAYTKQLVKKHMDAGQAALEKRYKDKRNRMLSTSTAAGGVLTPR